MKSWLFYRDPYLMAYSNPCSTGLHNLLYTANNRGQLVTDHLDPTEKTASAIPQHPTVIPSHLWTQSQHPSRLQEPFLPNTQTD